MKIRLPGELKERIERAAVEAQRTLNAEIVARLHASFNTAPAEFLQRFDRLALQVDALHKWMQHQPSDGGIEMAEGDEGPIAVGQVRPEPGQKQVKRRR